MNTNLNRFLKLIIFSFFVLPLCLQAGTVKQVKNNKVLIQLDNTKVNVGDKVFGLNSAKKKTSIIQISTIKNGKALGQVLKGTVKINDTILPQTTGKTTATNQVSNPADTISKKPSFIRKDLKKVSLHIKLSSDSITTKQQDINDVEETVEMAGTNFGFNGHYDIPLTDTYAFKAFAGIDMLKVAKSSTLATTCDGKTSNNCNVDINYLTFGGLIKASMPLSQSHLWGGIGAGFKQPLTKKSTALTEENIGLGNALIIAFGLDYHLSNKSFIPVSFEYQKSFNESDTVPSIKHMGLNIGYGFLF